MRTASILLAVCAAAAWPLRAHEGGHDVRGTVSAVGAKELTVKTSHGEEKFVLTPDTEFVKDGAPATAEDLKPADRAVVHSKKRGGKLEAVKVEFRSGTKGTADPKAGNPTSGTSRKP